MNLNDDEERRLLSDYIANLELLMDATTFLYATKRDFIARHPKYYLPRISRYVSELTTISNKIIELQKERGDN